MKNLNVFSRAKALVVVALGLMFGLMQSASAAIDVTATTTDLADVKTAVLAIGVAVLAIVVGIKLYKWVKQAL